MGLINKIKNVLFEEEEIEIPIYTKEEVQKKPEVKPVKKISTPVKSVVKEEVKPEVKPVIEEKKEPVVDNERETFKSEPTFQFPVFDESEFKETKRIKQRIQNSRKEEKNRKVDFGRFEEKRKVEEVKKQFKPSPVISPVYGILDKNYVKDDLTSKKTMEKAKVVDVDTIRNKAYGILEEEVVNSEDITVEKPTKSINELLMDSIEEEVVNNEEIKVEEIKNEDTYNVLDELIDDPKEVDESLESDLFHLIDSMYTSKEEDK